MFTKLLTKLKIHAATSVVKEVGEDHAKEISSMPKWAHVVLAAVFDVAGVYIGAKYPQYAPVVAAGAAVLGIPLTVKAYNTVPK